MFTINHRKKFNVTSTIILILVFIFYAGVSNASELSKSHKKFYKSGSMLDISRILDLKSQAGKSVETVTIKYNMIRSKLEIDWIYNGQIIGHSALSKGLSKKVSYPFNRSLPATVQARFTGPSGKIQLKSVKATLSGTAISTSYTGQTHINQPPPPSSTRTPQHNIPTQPPIKTYTSQTYSIPVKFINKLVSKHNSYIVKSRHIPVLNTDSPVIHPLVGLYQENPAWFKYIFSTDGESRLCGSSALGSVIIYLKYTHRPKYPSIGKKFIKKDVQKGRWVQLLDSLMRPDKNLGIGIGVLRNCAETLVAQGGYNTKKITIKGADSPIEKEKFAVSPGYLRLLSASSPDRAVVILFGWYTRKQVNGRQVFERGGGHYVALKGHDRKNKFVIYVSNPLVDYYKIYPRSPDKRYSKITLKRLPANVEAPDHMAWYTTDLVGGNFAILESIVVVDPSR